MKRLFPLFAILLVYMTPMPQVNADAGYDHSPPESCPMQITATTTLPTCTYDNCDGSISVSVTGGTPPYTYSPTTNLCVGLHLVTVTDANGCVATVNRYLWLDSPIHIAPGSSGTALVANTGSATVYHYGAIANPPITYDWSNGDSTQTIFNLAKGNYCVTVTDATGCERTSCVYIYEGCGAITIFSAPASAPGANDGSAIAYPTGTPPFSYSWSNGIAQQSASYFHPGVYCVTTTDATGCQAIACTEILDGTTGSDEITSLESVSVYPNPASDRIVLNAEFSNPVDLEVRLITIAGQPIQQYDLIENSQFINQEIDLSEWPPGMYLLELKVGHQVQLKKFVKF